MFNIVHSFLCFLSHFMSHVERSPIAIGLRSNWLWSFRTSLVSSQTFLIMICENKNKSTKTYVIYFSMWFKFVQVVQGWCHHQPFLYTICENKNKSTKTYVIYVSMWFKFVQVVQGWCTHQPFLCMIWKNKKNQQKPMLSMFLCGLNLFKLSKVGVLTNLFYLWFERTKIN